MVSYGGAEEILEETKLGVLYLGNFRADGKLQYVIRDVVLMMDSMNGIFLSNHALWLDGGCKVKESKSEDSFYSLEVPTCEKVFSKVNTKWIRVDKESKLQGNFRRLTQKEIKRMAPSGVTPFLSKQLCCSIGLELDDSEVIQTTYQPMELSGYAK